jgi:hypothetical protein
MVWRLTDTFAHTCGLVRTNEARSHARTLYRREICAAIGVSERTLQVCWHKHLARGRSVPLARARAPRTSGVDSGRFRERGRNCDRRPTALFWELARFRSSTGDAVRGVPFSAASPAGRCATPSHYLPPRFGICIADTEPLPHDMPALKAPWPDCRGRGLIIRQRR